MSKLISASDAKKTIVELLEIVATLGRVDIVRHGRPMASVLSPREFKALYAVALPGPATAAASTHMIPARLPRRARIQSPAAS